MEFIIGKKYTYNGIADYYTYEATKNYIRTEVEVYKIDSGYMYCKMIDGETFAFTSVSLDPVKTFKFWELEERKKYKMRRYGYVYQRISDNLFCFNVDSKKWEVMHPNIFQIAKENFFEVDIEDDEID